MKKNIDLFQTIESVNEVETSGVEQITTIRIISRAAAKKLAFAYKNRNIVEIPINQGQYLPDALMAKGYSMIPSNAIIDKTLPGIGATRMEIMEARDSIIIVPNVPVILGKAQKHTDVLAVYEHCTSSRIERYLKDTNIKHKKILTTPEGFKRVKRAAKKMNINIEKDYFLLFDECEKIMQDVDYRPAISQPINDFFDFKNKAFVSATYLPMRDPRLKTQRFKIFKVKPTYDYKKDIDLIITNEFNKQLCSYILRHAKSECVCIFLNSTELTDKIILTLGIEKESKIFCSKESVKKLNDRKVKDVFENIDLPLAKYNFFTCRFFSAVDIEIKQKPDILILSDLDNVYHTMIDPFTEAIQIYGRFRDKYHKGSCPFNSITHIANFDPYNSNVMTDAEVGTMIQTYAQTYNSITERKKSATNEIEKKALDEDKNRTLYSELLDDKGNLNYFSVDNLYNNERVKGYYISQDSLYNAYIATNHFNVNLNKQVSLFSEGDIKLRMRGKTSAVEKRKEIINLLEEATKSNMTKDAIEKYKDLLREQEVSTDEKGELIIDVYDLLGKAYIENLQYKSPATMQKALAKKKAELTMNSLKMFNTVHNTFKLNQKETKNDIKQALEDIFEEFGILGLVKLTQSTIETFFETKSYNGDKPATYMLTKKKHPQLGEKQAHGYIIKKTEEKILINTSYYLYGDFEKMFS